MTPTQRTTIRFRLVMAALFAPLGDQPVIAQSAAGTIAYVRATTSDEIRLIEPDGSNDRRLWALNEVDEEDILAVTHLDWHPQATALAFSSNHEYGCSLYDQDLYTIRPDGSGYRRLTNGPACAALASYPKGTVRVPVQNNSGESGTFFIYIQGASGVQQLSLPPGGSSVVTFNQVADFGAGKPQWAVAIEGRYRWLGAAEADVQPGETVETATLSILGDGLAYAAHHPSWRQDGAALAFNFGAGFFNQIEADPPVGERGQDLLDLEPEDLPTLVGAPRYAPTAERADQFLYPADNLDWRAVVLAEAGSDEPGLAYAPLDWDETDILGLDWLPDGSGFVHTVALLGGGSRLYETDLTSGEVTLLDEFEDYVAGISLSPDGEQMVVMRTPELTNAVPDLWIMDRDGSNPQFLVENGAWPDWSPQQVQLPDPEPDPADPTRVEIFLPALIR